MLPVCQRKISVDKCAYGTYDLRTNLENVSYCAATDLVTRSAMPGLQSLNSIGGCFLVNYWARKTLARLIEFEIIVRGACSLSFSCHPTYFTRAKVCIL